MYIGLDIGTTTLSAVVLDTATGGLLAHHTTPNVAGTFPGPGRAELDMERLQRLTVECLAGIVAKAQVDPVTIRGIGVTGQQHGVAFLDSLGVPVRPAITWQDLRAQEKIPGKDESYLQRLIAQAGGVEAFRRMGCLPAAGFLGTTVFWLHEQRQLPPLPFTACFIPDGIVTFLSGAPPSSDPTLAASSGVFDIVANDWDWALVERLGLPGQIFPPVGVAGQSAGGLRREIAAQTGLPPGLPVGVALGDNQASFIGSVAEPARSLLLNVGTGGQISACTDEFHFIPGLENRPFPGGHYLLIGGGLFGGRSYAYLLNFFRQAGAELFDGAAADDLYERMTALAARVAPGSDGLACAPFFTGSRVDPHLRASFTGLSPDNFTPGHFARALLEGMAEGFHRFGEQMAPIIGERSPLVGAGNGIRRNRLLAGILAERFAMPLHIPALAEEAAVGAAIVAAVGQGEFATLDGATARLLTYAEDTCSATPPYPSPF
ncbi:MAG: FGGY-family carbohydrate kinase [Caldilineaceae bacterium]|nr:FGGY-family carbohydrate kinase [Caldilineaceae bacterium]